MFHNYDPYEELESTKALALNLVQAHNNTVEQLQEMSKLIQQQSKEIRRLRIELDLLNQHYGHRIKQLNP